MPPCHHATIAHLPDIAQKRKVSRPTFDRASACFGQRGTITLTNLVACYAVLAYNVNTCEVSAPSGGTETPLP